MCAVLDVGVMRGFRFSTTLYMACTRLTLGSITWGPFVIVFLLLHGLLTLM